MEERRGFTIKDLLIRLILIIIFIFLLIWLFPMPDLKPLNYQIFADNIDRMKNVAKSYYTVERLPENINDYKKMTLEEMINQNLILPLMDSNGKYCSTKDSYVKVTKLENEYIIKVNLSCSDKEAYIIEHFGCYDICSDKCKVLESTTTASMVINDRVTKKTVKKTTKTPDVITTKKHSKLYEYEFMKNVCTEKFDKYVCPSGYYLAGSNCIKNGSRVVRVGANKKITNVTSTDTKDAKAVITSDSKKVDANKSTKTVTSTINANKSSSVTDEVLVKTQKVTAAKSYSYDVKGAVGTVKTTYADYITNQTYSVITADKYATAYKWTYVSTRYSNNGAEAFENDNEKLVLVDTYQELTCDTCFTTVTVYKYFRYRKEYTKFTYSCDAYQGYTLYDTNKCRKATGTTKSCPSGYTDSGSGCKKSTTTYSCSKYGSAYKLNEKDKTCTKTITHYSCPAGTEKTNDEKYCTKKVYGCPAGTTSIGSGKCSKTIYSCPTNTSDKTYILIGSICSVKEKKTVYTCPSGTVKTDDERYCVKTTSSTKYTCEDYPGYNLTGKKCIKTTVTPKVTYTCNKGYTLDGTTCYKTENTTDTKVAEKTYKTECNKEYRWSTRTSINGWSYTGNKRLLN